MKQRHLINKTTAIGALVLGLALYCTEAVLAQEPAKPAKEPIAVTTGTFHKVNHQTKGTATIYEFEGGARQLSIKGLDTADGPDVHVYVVADGDAKSSGAVKKAGFLDLGKLKTRKGDSTYEVPKDIDLWKYRAVTIWCKRYSVNFGTAPMAAAGK